MAEGKCAIWGTDCKVIDVGGPPQYDSSRAGGKYRLGNASLSSFPNEDIEFKVKLTSWLVDMRAQGSQSPEFYVNDEFIKKIKGRANWSTSVRIDQFIRYCSSRKVRPGEPVFGFAIDAFSGRSGQPRREKLNIAEEDIFAWTESISIADFKGFARFLRQSNFLNERNELSEVAFQRMERLERSNRQSKQAFVAKWFDPSVNENYENAIEPAILEAGFEPRIIRNVEHNNKIDDEIIAEIRRSKFVIADFTCGFSNDGSQAIARGGVYYEAGFAQGLGLPVIWTCHKDIIAHVHFDTRQYNHIVWETATDLKEKLLNRIRATIT